MRCKKGDLAVRVRNTVGGIYLPIGSIVRVLSRLPHEHYCIVNGSFTDASGWWNVEFRGVVDEYVCPECDLLPIRDNDGEDEMIRIAGKPMEVVN